jgi:phosphoribosyl 1,2-cyclic phosphodiesterase
MSLFITSLNSGSNGNCYYIGNDQEAVLIDAGISCRETEKRMKRLDLAMEKVKAIFVSHEHGDHITGVPGLSKKYQLPVYITPATLQDSRIPLEPSLVNSFWPDKPVSIGRLSITAFRKQHDAIDPHSFVISQEGLNIGVFTDIGICCPQVKKYFRDCDAVFLESNYCNDMLEQGRYPYHLKKRISGGRGHLSNTEALELFSKFRGQQLKYLILSHLSSNNNDAELVNRLFTAQAAGTTIVVASRYKETEVYRVDRMIERTILVQNKKQAQVQLSLF